MVGPSALTGLGEGGPDTRRIVRLPSFELLGDHREQLTEDRPVEIGGGHDVGDPLGLCCR